MFTPDRVLLQDIYLESEPYDPYNTWESIVTRELGSFAFKPLAGSSSGLKNLHKTLKKKTTKAFYWCVYIYIHLRIFLFIIHSEWKKVCKLSFLSTKKKISFKSSKNSFNNLHEVLKALIKSVVLKPAYLDFKY